MEIHIRVPATMKTLYAFASSSCRGLPRSVGYGLFTMFLAVAISRPAAGQEMAMIPEPRTAPHEQAVKQARELVHKWLVEKNVPGVSVAIGLGSELVWAEGFGWADLEQRVPVTPQTRFRIGSVSKPLTAAVAGLLYEQGHLDLDASIQKYVPSFPEKRWPISTRQLMSHTAGIRHYQNVEETLSSKHYDSMLETFEVFVSDTLLFRPGTRSSYSTYGWNLVGAVLEAVAGESYLEFMRSHVFEPIGMRHTVPDDVFDIVPNRASFYDLDADGRLRNANFVDQSNKWAGGGFVSTPSDLVRFGFAMLDGKLLKPETVELLWTPVQLSSGEKAKNGLGWDVAMVGGRRMIGHGGRSIGGSAALMIFPEQSMVVSVTTNVTGAAPAPIAIGMVRLFSSR